MQPFHTRTRRASAQHLSYLMAACEPCQAPSTSPADKQKQQTAQNELKIALHHQNPFEALAHASKNKLRTHTVTTRHSRHSRRARELLSQLERPTHHLHTNRSSKHAKMSAQTPNCASTRLKRCHTPANANYARAHAPLVAPASTTGVGSYPDRSNTQHIICTQTEAANTPKSAPERLAQTGAVSATRCKLLALHQLHTRARESQQLTRSWRHPGEPPDTSDEHLHARKHANAARKARISASLEGSGAYHQWWLQQPVSMVAAKAARRPAVVARSEANDPTAKRLAAHRLSEIQQPQVR